MPDRSHYRIFQPMCWTGLMLVRNGRDALVAAVHTVFCVFCDGRRPFRVFRGREGDKGALFTDSHPHPVCRF